MNGDVNNLQGIKQRGTSFREVTMSLSLNRLYLRCLRGMKVEISSKGDLNKGLHPGERQGFVIENQELLEIGSICVRLTGTSHED